MSINIGILWMRNLSEWLSVIENPNAPGCVEWLKYHVYECGTTTPKERHERRKKGQKPPPARTDICLAHWADRIFSSLKISQLYIDGDTERPNVSISYILKKCDFTKRQYFRLADFDFVESEDRFHNFCLILWRQAYLTPEGKWL